LPSLVLWPYSCASDQCLLAHWPQNSANAAIIRAHERLGKMSTEGRKLFTRAVEDAWHRAANPWGASDSAYIGSKCSASFQLTSPSSSYGVIAPGLAREEKCSEADVEIFRQGRQVCRRCSGAAIARRSGLCVLEGHRPYGGVRRRADRRARPAAALAERRALRGFPRRGGDGRGRRCLRHLGVPRGQRRLHGTA
jgi:hypothetical protein